MIDVAENLIQSLRALARQEQAPSQMLREIISRLPSEEPDHQTLIRYLTAAFCFTEGQAYPIFGWRPDGTGFLKDADLDYLLTKRIRQTRSEWDKTPSQR